LEVSCILSAARESGLLDAIVNARTKHGYTPLALAARGASADGFTRSVVCHTLIAEGADLNIPSAVGQTPIHIAARWGDPSVVSELVNSNAKVDELAAGNTTPLMLACDQSRPYVEGSPNRIPSPNTI